ncbi:SET domain-containing protein [Aureococcus anophagefferens]|nr:SET domain-containing protein [Aureococcus anophagefferens]
MAALVETTTQSLDSVTMAALLDTSKAADATDATDMSGVRVERSPLHGRGLFAARDFAAGETILVEAPLVAMQDLANRHAALVCGECLAFLDLGRDLLEAVAAGASPRVAADAAVARGGGPVARCADGCGELYCSAACRDAHRRRCHRALCVGPVAEADAAADPLVRYKILATESNEILFLAADVVAAALADGAAAAAFLPFTRALGPSSPTPRRSGDDARDGALLGEALRRLCGDAAPLLRDALAARGFANAADVVVTPEWLARIVGTFEQNNVGVRLRHPLDDDDDDEAEDDDDDDDDEDEAEDGGAVARAASLEDVDRLAAAPGAVAVVKFSAAWCAPCRAMAPAFAALAEALPEARFVAVDVDEVPDAAARFEAGALPTSRSRAARRRTTATPTTTLTADTDDGDGTDDGGGGAYGMPPLEGTALYSTICCANHACDQSCDVLYAAPSEPGGELGPGRFGAPLRASLVARRAVAAGDELTIAYVDTDAPWQERRAALADYGFLCRCSRCVAEMRCPKCA